MVVYIRVIDNTEIIDNTDVIYLQLVIVKD